MSASIFLSYRRREDAGHAGRLYDRVAAAFPSATVFMDVEGDIQPGADFPSVVARSIEQCSLVLVVIGPGWLALLDRQEQVPPGGARDFVRLEIESALRLNKPIVPVLLNEARMPQPGELPTTMRGLADCNAVRLRHERFQADAQAIVAALGALLERQAMERATSAAEQQRRLAEQRARHWLAWTPAYEDRARGLIRTLHSPAAVRAVGLGAGSETIISTDEVGTYLWELRTGHLIRKIDITHSSAMALSADGTRVAVASSSDTRILDVITGEVLVKVRTEANEAPPAVAFSPDGATLMVAHRTFVFAYSCENGKRVTSFKGHDSGVSAIAITPDGLHMVSGAGSRWTRDPATLRCWNLATGRAVHDFARHPFAVGRIAMLADSQTVAVLGADAWGEESVSGGRRVRLHDLASGDRLLAFDRTCGRDVLAATGDGTVITEWLSGIAEWSAATGLPVKHVARSHDQTMRCAVVSTEGRIVVSGGWDSTIRIWDRQCWPPLKPA